MNVGNPAHTSAPSPSHHCKQYACGIQKLELIKYYHAVCFCPTKAKWLVAIKRNAFKSWSGLKEDLMSKHFEKTLIHPLATCTKQDKATRLKINKKVPSPKPEICTSKLTTNVVFAASLGVNDVKPTGKICTDICRQFLHKSRRGYRYIFVMYIYDCNTIFTKPMKNRLDAKMLRVFNLLADKKQKDNSNHPSIFWTMRSPRP